MTAFDLLIWGGALLTALGLCAIVWCIVRVLGARRARAEGRLDEAGLRAFVDGLGPEWAGLSLTMPLKRVALEVAWFGIAVAAFIAAGILWAGVLLAVVFLALLVYRLRAVGS